MIHRKTRICIQPFLYTTADANDKLLSNSYKQITSTFHDDRILDIIKIFIFYFLLNCIIFLNLFQYFNMSSFKNRNN